jgi:kynurenine formamidase
MRLYDLTMPLDWEWMPDEVFPLATHFLLPPRLHPAKGITLTNDTGTHLILPSQFVEFRKTTRVHEIDPARLMLRETAVVSIPKGPGEEIQSEEIEGALAASQARAGDAILIRTGWGDRFEEFRGSDRYMLQSPHLTESSAATLAAGMDELESDLLLIDTALTSLPDRHLIPQWASLMPRPQSWPSEAARAYLSSYTKDRVREDWSADFELAKAGKWVVKKLIGCGALAEDRVQIIVAPVFLVRAIGATCRVIAVA